MKQDFAAINQKQNKEERRVYAMLFLVSIIALILGWWQIKNNIRLPFILPAISPATNVNNLDLTVSEDQLVLQNRDSDKDGLSDYNELYVYKTSPYLKDTDSDGYTDDLEIKTRNNPNCPAGQTCLAAPASSTQGAALAPRTTAELRALLKSAGVSEEQLAALDDATLLEVYNEIVAEGLISSESAAAKETNQSVESADASKIPSLTEEEKNILRAMSGAELREYLKQSGVDTKTLDNIDDATLKTLINQTLGL